MLLKSIELSIEFFHDTIKTVRDVVNCHKVIKMVSDESELPQKQSKYYKPSLERIVTKKLSIDESRDSINSPTKTINPNNRNSGFNSNRIRRSSMIDNKQVIGSRKKITHKNSEKNLESDAKFAIMMSKQKSVNPVSVVNEPEKELIDHEYSGDIQNIENQFKSYEPKLEQKSDEDSPNAKGNLELSEQVDLPLYYSNNAISGYADHEANFATVQKYQSEKIDLPFIECFETILSLYEEL